LQQYLCARGNKYYTIKKAAAPQKGQIKSDKINCTTAATHTDIDKELGAPKRIFALLCVPKHVNVCCVLEKNASVGALIFMCVNA
jgi:hypothetical protein